MATNNGSSSGLVGIFTNHATLGGTNRVILGSALSNAPASGGGTTNWVIEFRRSDGVLIRGTITVNLNAP